MIISYNILINNYFTIFMKKAYIILTMDKKYIKNE